MSQDDEMKNNVAKAREKFLQDVQKLGFYINTQGSKALEQRQQDEAAWPSKQKEPDASEKEKEAE